MNPKILLSLIIFCCISFVKSDISAQIDELKFKLSTAINELDKLKETIEQLTATERKHCKEDLVPKQKPIQYCSHCVSRDENQICWGYIIYECGKRSNLW